MKLKKEFLDLPDKDIGPLEQQWRDYRKAVIDPDATESRLIDSKRDFYAGAFTMMRMMEDADTWTDPPPEGMNWREAIVHEVMTDIRKVYRDAQTQMKAEEAAAKVVDEVRKACKDAGISKVAEHMIAEAKAQKKKKRVH